MIRARSIPFKACVLLSIYFIITGCALAPGIGTQGLGDTSTVEFPTLENPEVTQKIKIQSIDGRLLQAINKQQIQAAKSSVQTRIPEKYSYKVGPADILTIIVWDHPDLTIPAGAERSAEQAGTVVGEDGTIYFPYAGVVEVEGLTLAEIRTLLTDTLSRYIEAVKIDVRMAEYNSKRVYLVGEVKQPSVKPITNIPPTIIEMINAVGGFTEAADSRQVTLTRDEKTYRVDLLALYEDGDVSQNVMLKAGDVVNVADHSNNKVFVMGEVNVPGAFQMTKRRKSLAEVLSEAGGINQNTSNPGQVLVFRYNPDTGPAIFHLNATKADALLLADQFKLQPRDMVYVDAAKVVRWNRVISNISGTFNTINTTSQTDFPLFNGRGN